MDFKCDFLIPTQATLVHHDEPSLVCNVDETQDSNEFTSVKENTKVDDEIQGLIALRSSPACPDSEVFEQFELDEILNTFIPPVEWVDEGQMWRQSAAFKEIRRDDILTLDKNLNEKLKSRQASKKGVCPIRRQLYSQLLDELIRQITTLSPESGLLLMRVRDELRLTLDAQKSIYESCKFFESNCITIPKTPDSNNVEKPLSESEIQILEITVEKKKLGERIQDLQDGILLKEKVCNEIIDAEESYFQEQVEHLNKVKIQLEKQLELFNGPNPHAEIVKESILDQFLN